MPLRHSLRQALRVLRAELTPPQKPPDELLGDLLHDVQVSYLFNDSISFIDMLPPKQLSRILKDYRRQRHQPGFDLRKFVQTHFKPDIVPHGYITNAEHSIEQHIEAVWKVLKREEYKNKGSLIGLPYPYIVPGGRYQTMFYWDSYFVMLGLAAGNHWDMVENIIKNFAFMLRKFGHIPNGNRTYYIGRSQPPFFGLMVRLLAQHKGKKVLIRYLPYLLIEHAFWIKDSNKVSASTPACRRVMRMPDGELLNRYFDTKTTPRAEGYIEDTNTVLAGAKRAPSTIHTDIRAAAESGWDFTARWLKDSVTLPTIHTTDIVPVDLNCLLYTLEQTIASAYSALGSNQLAARYRALAKKRAAAINKYCWDQEKNFYFDYDVAAGERKPLFTLAGVFPLYVGIATPAQAKLVAKAVRHRLLKQGGAVSTTEVTGQQWDAPNGWPPLQWTTIRGLRRYQCNALADDIKKRWIATNLRVFKQDYKLVEKYNVADPTLLAGGGEYVLQDGFGWTNGVLLALLHEDALHWE